MIPLKTIILFSLSLFCLASIQAQQVVACDTPDNDTTIYTIVDEMPHFPSGDSAMVAYLTHNIHYPQTEKEKGIQGKVFVGFVVEKDGAISNVEVKKGIGEECDAEAVRVIKEMPTWNPGKQNNECVRVSMVLPISFKIVDQPQAPAVDSSRIAVIDKMPAFPGGEEGVLDFIGTHIRYPKSARHQGISGRVFVNFVVEPDGSITNVKVLKGIGGGCDEEAVRVVKMMPNWIPGEKDGKKVRVSYTLPINFRLQ